MMKSIPLVTAAFLAAGMYSDNAALDKALNHWDAGCYELTEQLVSYVPYITALAEAGIQHTGNVAGIFEYDVSEKFSEWFIAEILNTSETAMVPDPAACCAFLIERVIAFFREGPDAPIMPQEHWLELRSKVMAVPFVLPEGFVDNQYPH